MVAEVQRQSLLQVLGVIMDDERASRWVPLNGIWMLTDHAVQGVAELNRWSLSDRRRTSRSHHLLSLSLLSFLVSGFVGVESSP